MQSVSRLLVTCAMVAGFAGSALAFPAQDVVNGPNKQPLRSSEFGNCVRTKWSSSDDECAPAPTPKQVEVIQPAPATPQPVSELQRDQLTIYFNFNKSILTPGGKAKLDQIADAVNRSPRVTKVDIVGYTDQIGTVSYNEKLSVQRAKAVESYIDRHMRLPANVVGLRGLGKENPVVDCSGEKARAKKIVCMARDRRTEIEFEFEK